MMKLIRKIHFWFYRRRVDQYMLKYYGVPKHPQRLRAIIELTYLEKMPFHIAIMWICELYTAMGGNREF